MPPCVRRNLVSCVVRVFYLVNGALVINALIWKEVSLAGVNHVEGRSYSCFRLSNKALR